MAAGGVIVSHVGRDSPTKMSDYDIHYFIHRIMKLAADVFNEIVYYAQKYSFM